jgi:hypothetical protein
LDGCQWSDLGPSPGKDQIIGSQNGGRSKDYSTHLGQQPTVILQFGAALSFEEGQSVMTNNPLQGEGNYDAAREYDEKATKFAKDHKSVERAAQEAKDAIDGPERDALEAAEKQGKRPARH